MALAASVLASLAFSATALAGTVTTGSDLPNQVPYGYKAPANDGLGIKPGKVKHVWVIVLENKAYNASFTPLEGTQGQYLSKLPSQGALLTNYYGTGHSSLDNYLSMVSGQAPVTRHQSDCPAYRQMSGTYDNTPGDARTTVSSCPAAGPDAPAGDNGCVYPSSVPTLFNQLDKSQRELEGLRAGPRQLRRHLRRRHAEQPDQPELRRRLRRRRSDRRSGSVADPDVLPEPEQVRRHRTTSTAAPTRATSTSPSTTRCAWFESLLPASEGGTGGDTCARAPGARCSVPTISSTRTCRARARTPEFSYIIPEQLQQRARRGLRRQQPVGLASARRRRLIHEPAADQLHRRHVRGEQVPLDRGPGDREVAGVPGQRPDRRHLRRGLPAVHVAEQLRQLDAASVHGVRLADHRPGGRDAVTAARSTGSRPARTCPSSRRRPARCSARAPAAARASTARRRPRPAQRRRSSAARTAPPAPTATCRSSVPVRPRGLRRRVIGPRRRASTIGERLERRSATSSRAAPSTPT